ncbi:MAG TPA: pentapeptide repeat-containing protein [Anaerolineae bacterium]|nr:pentapeptide repeat-containing protein [Anaerolineae bacterium]HQH40071.1 pentapeptide repeat-containing protein [Anaerolineae bacterium]
MSKVLFEYYKNGVQKLIATVGDDHPQVPTLRILQQRLVENLIATSATDLSATSRAVAHANILDALNRLCLELTGKPFSAFCEVTGVTPASSPSTPEPSLSFAEYMHWLTSLLTANKVPRAEARATIQARTLAILEHSTPKEKGKVIQTLYAAGLISSDAPLITLAHADLKRAYLVEVEIDGVNLADANLQGVNLVGASLKEATLTRAILVGANLGWSTMTQSRLGEAELSGATLTGVNLHAADLHGAQLVMANLKRADLSQANLSSVSLLHANLEEAILTAANLSRAGLLWANFTHAELNGANLNQATYNAYTLWPENFAPAASGAVRIT